MSILTNEKCTACRRDSPQVTEAEIQDLKPQVPDWTLVERETIQRLERVFRVRDFAEALSFTNRVGALAEAEGHHPALSDRLLLCCRKNLRRVSGRAFCNFSSVGQRSRKSPTMAEPTAENQSSTCGKYIFKQAVRRLPYRTFSCTNFRRPSTRN